ncbi:MAG: tyrosine-type recombinase/integrase [Terriglobales bacterium]
MTRPHKGVYEKLPSSGIWWIRYADATGRIRREKAGTKGTAIKLYQKRKTSVLEGKKLPETLRAKRLTFSELSKDALEYSKTHKRSYGDDEIRMAKIVEAFGELPADSITPQDIERWLTGRQKLKPATLNRYRALLSLTYRLGMQNGKVSTNPARLVTQRRENNARIRFLSTEEETKLRQVIQQKSLHHLPQLDLALNTGLRQSEQYGLTWDCVSFERTSLTIPRSKNGETRHVPLNEAALAALEAVKAQTNGQPWVFLNCFGQRLVNPRGWFEQAIKDAGIKDFTWHCLRHTFASRLTMAGVDLRTVQELMGHKTISMTVRYSHLAPKHQLAAVQRLCNTESTQKEPTDTKTDTSTLEQLPIGTTRPN